MSPTPHPDKPPDLAGPSPPTRPDADLAHPTAAQPPAGDSGLLLAAGQRPLPDYELVGLLGRGGFGEVWKARGPGGFHVALKFVRLEQPAGESELRALGLMKDIRHAHLLALFGSWQRDGMLIIAMELADGTLLGRLRQAQADGHPGIPRDELLEYLREAAKGLDFLNERRLPGGGEGGPVGIQHKDVKPQNLLLAGGTVKVADFGLAKVMEHTVSAASRGLTAAYAAPEFFNGQATRWSDQYSLAVTYCELRGGRLPFEGNQFQLLAGHVMHAPDLTMLPEEERPAVARALAKKPEERWPSCRAFADALAEAGRPTPRPPVGSPVPDPGERGSRLRREGEALLVRRYRQALERTGGTPTTEDRDALSTLCRNHDIPTERATALLRQVRARWHEEHPAPHGRGGPSPPSIPRAPAPTGAAPAPRGPGRRSRSLWWLVLAIVPLVAAVPCLIRMPGLHHGPGGEHQETSPDATSGERLPGKGGEVSRPGAEQLPAAGTRFQRRALLIRATDYLYFNPIRCGLPGPAAHTPHILAGQLGKRLHVPPDQVVELSSLTPETGGKPGPDPPGTTIPPLKPVIEQTVGDFLDTSRAQDRILLLFVGHAVEIDGAVFLVPVEGEPGNKDTLIPLAWLYDRLGKCKARQKVLILDVCRFDPSRGFERPGSGSPDAKEPGTMTAKMDEALSKPPPGVQVWSACTKDQFSYEYDDNGVFLEALWKAGSRSAPDGTEHAEDPIRVGELADAINKRMELDLRPYGKRQTSRLAGAEPEGGAAYNPAEPPPPHVEPKPPVGPGDTFPPEQLRQLLAEIDVPPVRVTEEEVRLRAEAMPFFTRKVMQDYAAPDGDDTDFRKAVKEAVKVLNSALKGKRLRDEWPVPANEQAFKDLVTEYQRKEVAGVQRELTEALDSLKKAGTPEARAQEPKRWQAHYDFVLARLEERLASLNEYQSLLGQIRKELPPLDPKLYTGWRVVAQAPLNDSDAKKLAKEAVRGFDKIIKDYPDTPWAVLARRDRLTALGMRWQAARLGQ